MIIKKYKMTSVTKKSVSETGHTKNAASFQSLISFCSGFGEAYNPTKEALKVPQLQALLQAAQDSMDNTRAKKTSFDNATNSRKNVFADLKPLSTKIVNAFSVSGVDPLGINNLKSVNKKIQGASSKKTDTSSNDLEPQPIKTISTSQQSYDKMIEHFSGMIEVLVQHPAYDPNEGDLKVAALQTKLADMQTKNSDLINSYTQYSNAMADRNLVMYNPLSGLVQTAKEVKQYVKSVFGASSTQYKQINGIEFKTYKGA